MKTPGNDWIALVALIIATGLMVYLFAASRLDPSLRIAALVAGTGLVSTLAAIASTILTGKDLSKRESDLPPNSTATDTSTVKVGPTDPTQTKTGV